MPPRLITGPRVRAPRFVEGTWFNTAGFNTAAPLTLSELRGRFVLLDFWTFCCGNCLHVIDELRELERDYADVLTIVGVHSPKFDHERTDEAVGAAIERYGIAHPVLNDPQLHLWQQYAVRAWPTLVLIDPEGYVVAHAAGEGQASALAATIDALLPRYVLRHGADPYAAPAVVATTLRFPAKAIALPGGTTLVADAGHHQLVELAGDDRGDDVVRRIGSGVRGLRDGSSATAQFAEPNGLTLLPADVAARAGFDLVVADTANHVLRGVRLHDGAVVTTLDLPAALGDARTITGAIPPVLSPWDVVWWPALGRLVVAAAGVHLLLSVDPLDFSAQVLAGTTVEGLRDGPALDGWLAQPSGLAVDGDRLWFVDAETSALRYLSIDGELHTAVGAGLFEFGHVDGPASSARFQHPLGVTVLGDRTIAVLDTYNGAVRRYDPASDNTSGPMSGPMMSGTVTTLATDLREPSGALLVDGELVVVESAAHQLVRPVSRAELISGEPHQIARPMMSLAAGAVTLDVKFAPAPGRALDERYGPSTMLTVTASPPELLLDGAGRSTQLSRRLVLATAGMGVLQVVAQAASCDEHTAKGRATNPACYLARQDWGVPIRITADGDAQLELILLD